MKRIAKISGVVVLLLAAFVIAQSIKTQNRQSIQYIIFVSDEQDDLAGAVLAWSARRVLMNMRPTDADIAELNADAGARHIAKLRDQAFAHDLLKRFMKSGLSLEALDTSRQWTAVQASAIDGDVAGVRFLLANGAQSKKVSVEGQPLLEVLQRVSNSDANDDYPEIIHMLEL